MAATGVLAALGATMLTIPLGLDLYMPVPEDNAITPAKVELGRRLFNDRGLSRDGTVSCANCHDPARAFSTETPVAIGVFGRRGRRNAPALINRGYGRLFFWDGRAASLEAQALQPIQDPNEMDLSLEEAEARVGLDRNTIAAALATYVRTILSGDSPFDRFVNGDRDALSPDAQDGLRIFRERGNCTACHVGPTFSDEKLHNTGVAWRDGGLTDPGAGHGEFKTPTLRDVARTAPYMHDGSLRTLDEVVDFYSDGGRQNPWIDPEIHPLNLSAAEKQQLASFLSSLSGDVVEGRVSR